MKKIGSVELAVYKESIFVRIKRFFQKLFSKKENIEIVEEKVETENVFKETIKIEEDTKLLKLQNLLKEEIIKEEEIPEEDVELLHKLYDKQIIDLKNSINEYKKKTEELKVEANK